MPRNIVIWGLTNTLKSSLALASKRKKEFFEWDVGSFERAKKDKNLVEVHTYYSPPTALEDLGVLDFSTMGQSGKGGIRIARSYEGWMEVYWGFIGDYMKALKTDSEYFIVDTAKLEWEGSQNSMTERIQKDPMFKNMEARQLKRSEYQYPSKEQLTLIQQAKQHGKDLVWVGHAKELWDNVNQTYSGKFGFDGWSDLEDNADIVLQTKVESRKPIAIIRKGHLGMLGWELEGYTLDMVIELFDAAKAITDAEEPLPDTPDEVLSMAAVL